MDDGSAAQAKWEDFKSQYNLTTIDIPYAFTIGAINIAGLFHMRDPFEDSSTDGVVVGVVNGSYNLDKNNSTVELYDPTRQLFRLVMQLNIPGRELRGRFDNRKWDGGWNEGDWAVIWRG